MRRSLLVVGALFSWTLPLLVGSCGNGGGGGGPTTSDAGAEASASAPSFPFAAGAPWPKFRANGPQTGRAAAAPSASAAGKLWSFPTAKGIFSSPIVGADETIYVGSADRTFYALNPDGTKKWSVLTDEIIDSAGLLDDQGRVYFGSGDGKLRALDAATGSVVWTTPADPPTVNHGFINWFEGNVAITPSGRLYAPNDNFFVYGVDRATGNFVQKLTMPDQTWSLPAIEATTEALFIGNNNVVPVYGNNTFCFEKTGDKRWDSFSLGSIAASPLLTRDHQMIVGGFDGYVRAFDTQTGSENWNYGTRDHIYSSPAELPDGTIIQPSADGTVYALSPADGTVRWTYDISEPIRSSPAVDAAGNIYFGSGEGRLYSLDATGKLRWAIKLIDAPRHDINASPALGNRAVYVAGESGEVFAVPYDGCANPALASDARCTPPVDPVAANGATLSFRSQWGGRVSPAPSSIDANQALTFSLTVKSGGVSQLATIDPATLSVAVTPPSAIEVDVAGDGKFLTIVPTAGFTADASGKVSIAITGKYLEGFTRNGLQLKGGSPSGDMNASFQFTVRGASSSKGFPLALPTAPATPAGVWEFSRLALPLPSILPSYNQIGFDSLHYLIGIVEAQTTPAGAVHGTAWMIGAKLAEGSNTTVIDPTSQSLLPLVLDWNAGLLTLSNTAGLKVEVTNAVIPLSTFRIGAALGDDGSAPNGTVLSGNTKCAGIPTYGPFLQLLGLCNPTTDLLSVYGGSNFAPFGSGSMTATGVGTVTFTATADAVTATLTGTTLKATEHLVGVLLIDATTGVPVSLDYGLTTVRKTAADGTLQSVSVPITGKSVPSSLRAYLMVDATAGAMQAVTLH